MFFTDRSAAKGSVSFYLTYNNTHYAFISLVYVPQPCWIVWSDYSEDFDDKECVKARLFILTARLYSRFTSSKTNNKQIKLRHMKVLLFVRK